MTTDTTEKRRKKVTANPWPLRTLTNLMLEAAHEAHTMGRIYTAGGEVVNPADEWLRVEAMVLRRVKVHARRLSRRTR